MKMLSFWKQKISRIKIKEEENEKKRKIKFEKYQEIKKRCSGRRMLMVERKKCET